MKLIFVLLVLIGLGVAEGTTTNVIRQMPTTINSNAEFEVILKIDGDFPILLGINETIPVGFDFLSTNCESYEISGQKIAFAVVNVTEIKYSLRAPSGSGEYIFSGYWLDMLSENGGVIPSTTLKVASQPPPPPLVGGGSGGGGGGGGVVSGVPVYISGYITVIGGKETEIVMPQSAFWETNVLSLIVESSEDNNLRLRVEKLNSLPSNVPAPEGFTLVLILDIEPTFSKEAKIKGKIRFGIQIDEIRAKGFDPNAAAVILLKWDGKQWIELQTRFLSSDGKYNYYEATTESFSYFVAAIKSTPKSPKETPVVTTTPLTTPIQTIPTTHYEVKTTPSGFEKTPTTPNKPSTPGFEAIFAIAGLIALAYLLRIWR
ncbi:MAG: PGF-pre-PGF domain-containing protein [Archaeoglobaceae archaeon]|nr:PGF-pre-PGF domain-containing protein [Archaeoglobaceae archaeon]